jgi:hypothetical protein
MRPHPRIRKTIKWVGAAVTVLLVVVWIESWWLTYPLGSWGPRNHLAIELGIVEMERWSSTRYLEQDFIAILSPSFRSKDFGCVLLREGAAVRFPLWFPALCIAIVTVAAWCLDELARRRAPLNLCPNCHYDRAGIAAGAKCPECGSAAP